MEDVSSFPFRFSLCKYLDEFSSLHIMVYVREIYAVSRGAWISRNRLLGRLFASEERPRLWFLNLFNTVFLLAFFFSIVNTEEQGLPYRKCFLQLPVVLHFSKLLTVEKELNRTEIENILSTQNFPTVLDNVGFLKGFDKYKQGVHIDTVVFSLLEMLD